MQEQRTVTERIQEFQREFEAKFKRPMTAEEKRILDLAEKLLRERTAKTAASD